MPPQRTCPTRRSDGQSRRHSAGRPNNGEVPEHARPPAALIVQPGHCANRPDARERSDRWRAPDTAPDAVGGRRSLVGASVGQIVETVLESPARNLSVLGRRQQARRPLADHNARIATDDKKVESDGSNRTAAEVRVIVNMERVPTHRTKRVCRQTLARRRSPPLQQCR